MLLGWANQQFGFSSDQALFDAMKDAVEAYHPAAAMWGGCAGAGSIAPFPPAISPATAA